MNITATTVALEVEDRNASTRFFTAHLGFREVLATESCVALGRDDASPDIVLIQRDADRPPEPPARVVVSFSVTGIAAEARRLRAEGAAISRPLRLEPWGEWTLQLTDPNGIVVQLVEWQAPSGA
jgi:predicted enzyme related to lactoylglutathione lyase